MRAVGIVEEVGDMKTLMRMVHMATTSPQVGPHHK